MNIEELKSILISANVCKRRYAINDWNGWLDQHVLQSKIHKGHKYWEVFYFDERGNINVYKSFISEDIACRYYIYILLYDEKDYQHLIKKYVLDYTHENKTLQYGIREYYGVNNFNDVMEYDRYKRNVMHYMLEEIYYGILLSLLFNSTIFQLLDDVKNIKNPNFCDTEGCSYLHLACLRNNIQVVKVLLELGANPNIRNCNGEIPALLLNITPVDVNLEILELMLQYGLDLNTRFSAAYGHMTLKEMFDRWWNEYELYRNIIKKYTE